MLSTLSVLALPPKYTLLFLLDTAPFCLDLRADFALLVTGICGHDQLHTTCLAGSVLFGTVLSEVTPLIIAADKLVLVEETHVDCCSSVVAEEAC